VFVPLIPVAAQQALQRTAIVLSVAMLIVGCQSSTRAYKFGFTGPSGIAASTEVGPASFADRLWECRQHGTEHACIAFANRVAEASCHDAIASSNVNYGFCHLCVRSSPSRDQWTSCMALAQSIAKGQGNASTVEITYDPSRPVSLDNVPPGSTQDPGGAPLSLPLPPLAKDDPSAPKTARQFTNNKSTVSSITANRPAPATARRSLSPAHPQEK
jgi:hypothetical protein